MAETPFWLWKPHFSRFEMSSGPNPVGFSLFPQDFTKQSPIPSACWCVVSEEKKRSGLVLLDFRKGEKIVAGINTIQTSYTINEACVKRLRDIFKSERIEGKLRVTPTETDHPPDYESTYARRPDGIDKSDDEDEDDDAGDGISKDGDVGSDKEEEDEEDAKDDEKKVLDNDKADDVHTTKAVVDQIENEIKHNEDGKTATGSDDNKTKTGLDEDKGATPSTTSKLQDKSDTDELTDDDVAVVVPKRKRGRPPNSQKTTKANEDGNNLLLLATQVGTTAEQVQGKQRGRPRKTPKPTQGNGDDQQKKPKLGKRGRPRKSAESEPATKRSKVTPTAQQLGISVKLPLRTVAQRLGAKRKLFSYLGRQSTGISKSSYLWPSSPYLMPNISYSPTASSHSQSQPFSSSSSTELGRSTNAREESLRALDLMATQIAMAKSRITEQQPTNLIPTEDLDFAEHALNQFGLFVDNRLMSIMRQLIQYHRSL